METKSEIHWVGKPIDLWVYSLWSGFFNYIVAKLTPSEAIVHKKRMELASEPAVYILTNSLSVPWLHLLLRFSQKEDEPQYL